MIAAAATMRHPTRAVAIDIRPGRFSIVWLKDVVILGAGYELT